MNTWLLLVLSLPTENATLRQRVWRALKALGAAVLRDGVYLMPERAECRAALEGLAEEVRAGRGSAHVLPVQGDVGAGFVALFDRSVEFAALIEQAAALRQMLDASTLREVLRQSRKLRKSLASLTAIDFFPGEAGALAAQALQDLEQSCAQVLSPHEPQFRAGELALRALADYQGRLWATRRRPWVDRLASAWLIRRFIDAQARFLWLDSPEHCPADALGFDFDGAAFSHVGQRVTFEVLLASFSLEQPALTRLGQLVHYLDVGGHAPPEAAGVESVLAGLREHMTDDDQLLDAACAVFDALLASFEQGITRT